MKHRLITLCLGMLLSAGLVAPVVASEEPVQVCDKEGASTCETDTSAAYYDEYDDTQSHPVRLAAYALHPVGYAAEWLVFRPLHYVVSLPYVAEVFGHHPHGKKVIY